MEKICKEQVDVSMQYVCMINHITMNVVFNVIIGKNTRKGQLDPS